MFMSFRRTVLSSTKSRGDGHVSSLLGGRLDTSPWATIVFDHFHVIKLFNDRLSDLRRGRERCCFCAAA